METVCARGYSVAEEFKYEQVVRQMYPLRWVISKQNRGLTGQNTRGMIKGLN